MSTAESMISEIDTEYQSILNLVKDLMKKKTDQLTIQDGRNLLAKLLGFQRFMEARELSLKVFKGAAYFERASATFHTIVERTRSDKAQENFYFRATMFHSSGGLSVEARSFFNTFRSNDNDLRTGTLIGMNMILEKMEPDLAEFYADLRLMAESEVFPVERRMILKDKLIRAGYTNVVELLESAEQNLTTSPPHLRDVLPNCRSSLEAMFYKLMESKGQLPTRKFSIDLAAFSVSHPNLIDNGTKQMIQGVYSFLSVKGSHAMSPTDKAAIGEIELGMEQTYRMLSLLLAKDTSS